MGLLELEFIACETFIMSAGLFCLQHNIDSLVLQIRQ